MAVPYSLKQNEESSYVEYFAVTRAADELKYDFGHTCQW
jgi:hypothetical protein